MSTLFPPSSDDSILFWVGILLIISAGSFLYVATLHILPEVLLDRPDHHHHHNLKDNNETKHFSKSIEIISMIVGLMAPLGLSFM